MSDAGSDKPKQKKPRKSDAPKKWAQSGDIYLNVGEHVEKEEMIDHQQLRIDYKQEYGQIRAVDPEHVKKLVKDFEINPPHILDLTCWRHPGMNHINTPVSHPIAFLSGAALLHSGWPAQVFCSRQDPAPLREGQGGAPDLVHQVPREDHQDHHQR
jgi:hypothetical protein